jgi:glycosyltransferase involved in cell wall biosynthesis
VLAAVPDAELHVIGTVGEAVEPVLPRVRLLGKVEDLARAYAAARVVINPSVAGTGLKIKTLEALACLRPIVVWPSGVDGLNSELRELCHVATSWFDFAEHVIGLALDDGSLRFMIEQRTQLVREFAPDVVYAPLGAVLDHALSEVRS